jgi:membrane-associated phospholipid phosphatase
MSAFFAGYFSIQNDPRHPVTVVPALPLDGAIAFSPYWIFPYLSLWPYVSLYPALLTERRLLARYALAAVGLGAAGLAIFHRWPTAIVQPEIDWDAYPLVAFLKTVDAAGNVCPSLHVAFAVFTADALDRLLRGVSSRRSWRMLNLLWAAAIVYSTLATKQHVVLDVAAGIALGGLAALIHGRSVRGAFGPAAQEGRCPPPPARC